VGVQEDARVRVAGVPRGPRLTPAIITVPVPLVGKRAGWGVTNVMMGGE